MPSLFDLWIGTIGVAILAAVVGNLLWITVKVINVSHGYPVHLFLQSRDLREFRNIMDSTADPARRRRDTFMLYALYGCLGVAVGTFAISALGFSCFS